MVTSQVQMPRNSFEIIALSELQFAKTRVPTIEKMSLDQTFKVIITSKNISEGDRQ